METELRPLCAVFFSDADDAFSLCRILKCILSGKRFDHVVVLSSLFVDFTAKFTVDDELSNRITTFSSPLPTSSGMIVHQSPESMTSDLEQELRNSDVKIVKMTINIFFMLFWVIDFCKGKEYCPHFQ